jgi:mRNA interferase MazF
MKLIKQFDIWLANLNPAKGTEPGKIRPVVIIQSDLLNAHHNSTVICPLTTKVQMQLSILRIHSTPNQLDKPSDILVDQVRAIDNKRLIEKAGELNKNQISNLKESLKIILDL